jgi:hypothetical protein
MSMMLRRLLAGLVCILSAAGAAPGAFAADDDKQTMKLGPVTIVAPKEWTFKKPAVSFIAYEFTVPASKDDKTDGRFTASSAGGTVEQNITRWYDQFTQDDGGDTKKRAKTEKKTIAGQTVHFVDANGTYRDLRPGTSPQKGYRLLGAIIETDEGNIFLKLVGPQRTLGEHEKAFRRMVEDMRGK